MRAPFSSIPTLRRLGKPRLAALLAIPLLLSACGITGVTTGVTAPQDSATPARTEDSGSSGLGLNSYTPKQLRVVYGVESLFQKGFTGKGQTVVVIDSFGSPTLQQDLDVYSQKFNLPHLTLKILAPLGTKPFDPSNDDMVGWSAETTEDVQVIHAMAPEANITVLTSPIAETEGVEGLPEFLKLEQYAVDNHLGNIVSESFGASEISLNDTAGRAHLQLWNDFYQKATTQQGVTFIASSGDGGATDYANATDAANQQLAHTPSTGFPADSPWVTSIGGTRLTIRGTDIQEGAWSDSGGGFSVFNAQPDYQKLLPAAVQTQFRSRRGVPDVASTADVDRGPAMYWNGRWTIANGTSCGSPLWSGIIAVGNQLAGHPLGFLNPAIYKVGTSSKAAQDFRDITTGNNSQPQVGVVGYPAVPGWDPVTGFGAPIADKLLPDLISAQGAA